MGIIKKIKELITLNKTITEKQDELSKIEHEISDKNQLKEKITNETTKQAENKKNKLEESIRKNEQREIELLAKIQTLNEQADNSEKKLNKEKIKLLLIQDFYKSIQYSINIYFNKQFTIDDLRIPLNLEDISDELKPNIILKLHCMDIKELRKAFNENEKQIEELRKTYSIRYTTKTNQAIYSLMVIALKSELQNVLYNLKYDKLEKSIESIKNITKKYYTIATDGNQNIAPTMLKFIGEIEYFFIKAVRIEYEYYVKKEREKEEQAAIREQMKQEEAERKELERQKKLVEREEEKYTNEINNLNKQLESKEQESEESKQLRERILELEQLLQQVENRKEEIVNLQNGQAGYVYVISNLGSFGDNVFKIGMTRRLNPQDRVDELGNASVPFKFDVHSFIFSENAVKLESQIHETLKNKRVNKINIRKEFFKISLDELEKTVISIEPTAEFNRTMLAEQYRLSKENLDES